MTRRRQRRHAAVVLDPTVFPGREKVGVKHSHRTNESNTRVCSLYLSNGIFLNSDSLTWSITCFCVRPLQGRSTAETMVMSWRRQFKWWDIGTGDRHGDTETPSTWIWRRNLVWRARAWVWPSVPQRGGRRRGTRHRSSRRLYNSLCSPSGTPECPGRNSGATQNIYYI